MSDTAPIAAPSGDEGAGHMSRSKSDLDLLNSGLLSDAVVVCGDREWKVHKIIMRRCAWFKSALFGGFQESKTGKVTITDFPPHEIEWLLKYIYSDTVDWEQISHGQPTLEACIRLWVVGDYFHEPKLMSEADNRFKAYCMVWVKEACRLVNIGQGMDFMSDLEAAIRALWSGPTENLSCSMKSKLIVVCCLMSKDLDWRESFFKVLEDHPQFASTLLRAILRCRHEAWAGSDGARVVSRGCKSCNKNPVTDKNAFYNPFNSFNTYMCFEVDRYCSWGCLVQDPLDFPWNYCVT